MSAPVKCPVVYFAQIGHFGPIKVGQTDKLEARLAVLATYAPEPLRLLFAFPGTLDVERSIHERFAHIRTHREWYRPDQELLAFIEQARQTEWPTIAAPAEDKHPEGAQPMALQLTEAIDAHVRSQGNEDGYKDVAKRAGMSKQQLANLRAGVEKDPDYVIKSDVAERLARAIGLEVRLVKKGTGQ
jgi:transcriptional regulator with XRE-family HTH domain